MGATRTIAKGSVEQMVQRVLRPGMTAVDVGAAHGVIVGAMRKAVGPEGTIIAIEPRDTVIDGADVIHRVAVGPQACHRAFHLAAKPTNSSLWERNILPGNHTGTMDVEVVPLDDLVERADLVKIDVQGGEIDVLASAPRLLGQCPAWILEVWPFGLQNAQHTMADLWVMLERVGLVPHDGNGERIAREDVTEWLWRMSHHLKHMNWLCLRS